MPAILKGWVDRVYAYGFAYGVGEHSDQRWGDRFGEGTLVGKRAMLIVTTGGWEEHYSARGVNGPIDDLLFPVNHGVLYYPAMTYFRRSWSTELIVSMRPGSSPLPNACARGCGRSRPPRPSPIGSRMAATI
jgi:putative NADPH-quinone reductase